MACWVAQATDVALTALDKWWINSAGQRGARSAARGPPAPSLFVALPLAGRRPANAAEETPSP